MEDVYQIVCSYEKVREHLKSHPEDKKKIHKFIDEIKGGYSSTAIKGLEKFLDTTFVKLYDGVNLELPEGFDLKKCLETYHVILCPNHQSHADYIAIQYVLYKKYKLPVFIAAGINLNIFPIGNLFKKCGAFFIRRRFDDELYKIAFQGYIYYLLKTDKVVEFFFEGGRTRTGKLLPPRYGLFSMILDAHTKFDDKKPLMFIPVSIAHEQIPEEKAHAKELGGAKKEKEKTTQLFKLFTLFNKKLGTVHIRFGEANIVTAEENFNLKEKTQQLAFNTFRSVGKAMPVTPSALLSLILLDEPSGAITWKQLEQKVYDVIEYCEHMGIPLTTSLRKDNGISAIRSAMDMFINNDKVELIKRKKLNQIYYSVREDSRVHLLYHKNMIVHHFFVPAVMNGLWYQILSDKIKDELQLKRYLLKKRKELKYEFYLPKTEEMLSEGIKVIEYSIGKKINKISEVLEFNEQELERVSNVVKRFSTALSYIYEAYYISAVTVQYLAENSFDLDTYLQTSQELFDMEKEHGRIIKYSESFSVPKMKASLEYLMNLDYVEKADDTYHVKNVQRINLLIESFAGELHDQLAMNLRFSSYGK